MSKYLIVYAHPGHDGHNGYLLKVLQDRLKAKNLDFEVLDLYQLKWDPVLKNNELYTAGRKDVAEETKAIQQKIKTADRLIFIYPTWWQNMPAILKGFFDRVFIKNFAYVYKSGIPIGLLRNKRAAVFTTTSGRAFFFYLIGQPSLRLVTRYTLLFCGIRSKGFFLGKARKLENNKTRLEKIAKRIISYLAQK